LIKQTIIALSAALLFAAPAYAQEMPLPEPESAPANAEPAAEQHLLPESVNLSLVDGSSVPTDCQYPSTINDTATFELACVTMPRVSAGLIGAEYLAQLGTLGWRQGAYIEGGMTAVRSDESNCERVLNIFPSNYPPGAASATATTTVIWFVLERTPRCNS
jgi:hypothetical protein